MTHTTKHTQGPLHNITGHKPGPWIRQVLNDESEAYIHDKHCNAIARVYSLSDAALIAAAPAMYEALQQLVKVEQLRTQATLDNDYVDLVLADQQLQTLAQAALAQAEGR